MIEVPTGRTMLFSDLSAEARVRIRELVPDERVEIEAGASRTASAFPGAAFLLVDDGFVVLRATFAGISRAVITGEAGPGRLLRPPTSSEEELVALTPTRILIVPNVAIVRLLETPAVAERIVDALSATLAQAQEAIANFAAPQHAQRVRRKLLQLARRYGHVVRDGVRIDFPISHALLAEMIGSSRETVTRAVDELQRAGFIARSGSTYRLRVPPDAIFDAA